MSAQRQIEKANERLRRARVAVSIRLRGKKLSLRGVFPPKPNSGKTAPHRQTLALSLFSTEENIQQAEAIASQIGTQLLAGTFSWHAYLKAEAAEPLSELIKRFEEYHRSKNKISDYTWKKHYMDFYERLPQDEPLAIDSLMSLVLAKTAHTRARKQACIQLQKLCDFAGIKVNLLDYQGTYNSSTSVVREIPLDEDIAAGFHKMKSPQWRWIYGIMAAYGLRDHECWFCEFNKNGDLQVLEGKTGPRLIQLPLYPEWVDEWQLRDIRRPKVKVSLGRNYLAERCGKAFRRSEIGFSPYTLRYAYGHRGSVTFSYEAPIMAVQMGHSLDVHIRTYQRFINAVLVNQKVAEMKARQGLPSPPKLSQ